MKLCEIKIMILQKQQRSSNGDSPHRYLVYSGICTSSCGQITKYLCSKDYYHYCYHILHAIFFIPELADDLLLDSVTVNFRRSPGLFSVSWPIPTTQWFRFSRFVL